MSTSEVAPVSTNPFFAESQLYLNYPPFDQIENAHYLPAFLRGMAEQSAEIEAIAQQSEPATFTNTIVAMELSGQLLNRTANVFFAMSSAHTNDEIRALEQQLAPQLAAHDDSIMLNRELFGRISRLYEQREELALDAQSIRLLEEYYSDFVRAGAALSVDQQQRMKELNAQIATLQTRYSQQILSEMNELAILVDSREELTGLDESLVAAAEAEADERGLQGRFVIPLLNTSGQPALASLQNRAVRERMHNTSLSRGNRGGEFDNRGLLVDILRLRAERAQLLGFENHAHYILEDRTAQTVAAVNGRLAELTPPAVANARREAADLQQMIY
ncbi:MAG: M3 family metallopeptidase, partial [Gammaproteobacteria bacterium]|nr:M3 family metallopeptidase [Gammaproteobacteria bacterium]